jgi:hypothetical protein
MFEDSSLRTIELSQTAYILTMSSGFEIKATVVIRIGNNENARNNSNPISFMIKC